MGHYCGTPRWRELEDGISLLVPQHFGELVLLHAWCPAFPMPHTARGPQCCVLMVGACMGLALAYGQVLCALGAGAAALG